MKRACEKCGALVKIAIGLVLVCAVVATAVAAVHFFRKDNTEELMADVGKAENEEPLYEMDDAPPIDREEQEPEQKVNTDEDGQTESEKTSAWKTEERYKHTKDGTSYLSVLTEYNSREDVTREVLYSEDGSIARESKWNNEYSVDGKLVKTIVTYDGESGEWGQYEYDGEGRVTRWSHYDGEGRLMCEEPYSYDYDEQINVWYCDHMALFYDENGVYTSSGISNHEAYSYDEENRITAYYAYPLTAQCHIYGKTEAQIRQILQEISLESENRLYRSFAEVWDEYGQAGIGIEVYRYDEEGILQEIDSYDCSTASLDKKVTCTYEYDSEGRIQRGFMESENETVHITYCYDAEEEFQTVSDGDMTIKEVTWEEEGSTFTKQMLYFMLADGTVIEQEAADVGIVKGVDYRDITGDGIDEAVVSIYFANVLTEYTLLAIYQVQDGKVVDISPAADMEELWEDAWDAEIVSEPVPGYGLVLKLTSYERVMPGLADVADEMTVGYKDGGWHVIQHD